MQIKGERKLKALDFGVGGGRHLKMLKDIGYDCYGLDISPDARDTLVYNFGADMIPSHKLIIDDILQNPNLFPDGFFDVILSVGVVWSGNYEKMMAMMRAIVPKLKSNGNFVANFRTKFDSIYQNAVKVEDDGCSVKFEDSEGKYHWTFLDTHELRKILSETDLTLMALERYERHKNNLLSYWHVWAQKS
jgi:SAM-dependent methyltransferase